MARFRRGDDRGDVGVRRLDYLAISAGEVREPGRIVPRALILGTLRCVIYLAVNVGYLLALTQMAGKSASPSRP